LIWISGPSVVAARQEAGSVDVVVLPESAVDEREIGDLETLLQATAWPYLNTGVRGRLATAGRFPGNWLHIGINPRLEKGGPPPIGDPESWFHIRQNKHHRWSLDEGQITQYHLGGVLHPHVRWWEAMEVPRWRCSSLNSPNSRKPRSSARTLRRMTTSPSSSGRWARPSSYAVLLDGPQLTSRWAARYASVLADDPGSAVLTLASLGMVERSRPHGRDPSRVIALWKDSSTGVREIPLEPGAHGVLLTVTMDRATRRSADGRAGRSTTARPAATRPSISSGVERRLRTDPVTLHHDDCAHSGNEELTILTGWAEGVSEAAAYAPERIDAVLADAHADATWRAELGLPQPSPRLATRWNHSAESFAPRLTPHPAPPLFDENAHRSQQGSPRRRKTRPIWFGASIARHARRTSNQAIDPSADSPVTA
jgi:hypothetical protein